MVKIGPKAPYNLGIFSFTETFHYHHHHHPQIPTQGCVVFWSVYNSTAYFKIVDDAKRTTFVAVISGMIGSHCGFRAFLANKTIFNELDQSCNSDFSLLTS